MPGNDAHRRRQHFQAFQRRGELPTIAARQIGPSNRTGKKRVAAEHQVVVREPQANAPRRVPGRFQHLETGTIRQSRKGPGEVGPKQRRRPRQDGIRVDVIQGRKGPFRITGVQKNRRGITTQQGFQCADMVNMPMRQQVTGNRQAPTLNPIGNGFGIPAGIADPSPPGWLRQDRAIDLECSNSDNVAMHNESYDRRLGASLTSPLAPACLLRMLVTAGPTREALDPVRFISNRSSGRMGYAIAAAARARGHTVTLISGPVTLRPPAQVSFIPVTSARDMLSAVRRELPAADVLIMAAAVADWRPLNVSPTKCKKSETAGDRMALDFVRNPDILESVRADKADRLFVGFAAETGNPAAEGFRKLRAKGLDLLLANDVSQPDAGFEVDTNRIILLSRDGCREDWPLMPKTEAAARLISRIEMLETLRRSEPDNSRCMSPKRS